MIKIRALLFSVVASILSIESQSVLAKNILITNDDGLTSNVVALYGALKKRGHDVIVSVPCMNQSGMSAALSVGRPILALTKNCLNSAAEVGSPGVGPMTRKGVDNRDFYYANGTPVMAMLYGLDVLAQARWGDDPDLVISGPNEGQNVGAVILSSGTVSNAHFATIRGIPAIALSAGTNTRDNETLNNPISEKVAARATELIAALETLAGEKGSILPAKLALNVNFPDEFDEAEWNVSRIGTYQLYELHFVDSFRAASASAIQETAEEHGLQLPDLPGVLVRMNSRPPRPDQENDEAAIIGKRISISPMWPGYDCEPTTAEWAFPNLEQLLNADRE